MNSTIKRFISIKATRDAIKKTHESFKSHTTIQPIKPTNLTLDRICSVSDGRKIGVFNRAIEDKNSTIANTILEELKNNQKISLLHSYELLNYLNLNLTSPDPNLNELEFVLIVYT